MLLSGGKGNKAVFVMLCLCGISMCLRESAWKEINQMSTIAISDTEIMAIAKSLIFVCINFFSVMKKIK